MNYFVTGATGFIGRFLLERLVERDGTIYALVRQGSVERLETIARLAGAPDGKVVPIVGELGQDLLGIKEADLEQLEGVDHFFHLAAIYDVMAKDAVNWKANVDGCINAVGLANHIHAKTFQHISSIAVSGRYNGRFMEDMFDRGQKIEGSYERTKFEAERIVRDEVKMPWRIYRPGIVVGHSKTGEIDKIDGPYFTFKHFKRLRKYLPAWVPTPGIGGGRVNIVPVDFVANAIDHIAHKPKLDGKVFQLVDPYPPSFGEAITTFGQAANAPSFSLRTDNAIVRSLPRQLLKTVGRIPVAGGLTDSLLNEIGLPKAMWMYLDNPTTYDCTNTLAALKGTKIGVPPLESYANKLFEYWERNFDPAVTNRPKLHKVVDHKVVVVTGASSGIGEAVAHSVGRAGAKVVLIARSAPALEVTKREIEAGGGEAYVHTCDLADPADCDRLVEEILQQHGRVDVLVNNAGRSIRRSVENSYDRFHDFERTMQLNYFGSLKLILGFLPGMRDRQWGRIVNVSSIGALSFPPRFSSYVASKSALDAFSRCIASEIIGDGCNITTVYMPLVKTPMIAPTKMYNAFPTITPQDAAELVLKGIVDRPVRVTTGLGTFGSVLHATSPRTAQRILNTAYQLFPESAAASGRGRQDEVSAEAMAFAQLTRGVYW